MEAVLDAASYQVGCVWMAYMPDYAELCQEFSLLVLVFVSRCQSLHCDALAVVELPSEYFGVSSFPHYVL